MGNELIIQKVTIHNIIPSKLIMHLWHRSKVWQLLLICQHKAKVHLWHKEFLNKWLVKSQSGNVPEDYLYDIEVVIGGG